MADEAKLTVELVDRSGGSTAAPAPGVAPSTNIPGSDLANQFQQQASNAGSKAGQGSMPAGAPPVSPAAPPPSAPAPTPSVGDFVSSPEKGDSGESSAQTVASLPKQPSGDALLDVVRGLLGADQGIKPGEVQAALGVPKDRAEDLLSRARSFNQTTESPAQAPSQSQPATPPGQSGSQLPDGPLSYYFNTTPAQRDAEQMFGDTEAARARDVQTNMRQAQAHAQEQAAKREEANAKPPTTEFSSQWLKKIDPAQAAANAAAMDIQSAAEMEMAATAEMAGTSLTRNLGSLAAGSIGGPGGSAVGMIANQIAPMVGQAAGASSLGPTVAAMAPAVGGVAITGAIASAVTSAINSHLEDSYRRIRDLNPDVAMADARNELRQLRADFATSSRLGDEIANLQTARSQFSTQMQGLKDRLVEGPADVIGLASKAGAAYLQGSNQLFDKVDSWLSGIDSKYGSVITKLNSWLDSVLGEDNSMSSFDWFDHQPHLSPPPPFMDDYTEQGDAKETDREFHDIPGLRF